MPISYDPTQITIWTIAGIAIYVLFVVAVWKMFVKAGVPGWFAIIPILNSIYIVKIAGYSGWLFLLFLVPVVNIVWGIIVAIKLGAAFGKGGGWSFFLLWLLSVIGYLILGFGSAQYTKPATATI